MSTRTYQWVDGVITRKDLRCNPRFAYIFGDNLISQGRGGMAGEMRGEPNAFGIPTKRFPAMTPESFFSDNHYDENIRCIIAAIDTIPGSFTTVIVPKGLGRGLAQLHSRAPRTYVKLVELLTS
jgi:hypothetical protein